MSISEEQGVAILGAGIFAKEAHLPALASLGKSAPPLKAVYSRSERSANDLAKSAIQILNLTNPLSVYHDEGDKSTDLDTLLSRSDITSVIIALPITIQPTIILKALSAGLHVLSEKPVAADVQRGLELIAEYNAKYKPLGLVWRVAENFEAEPGFRAAAEAIKAGKIGKVQTFKAVVVNHIDKTSKWYNTPWRTIPEYQGGFLLDGGVHTIAALRLMLPHAITQLSGHSSLNKEYLAPHDTIHAIVRAGPEIHGITELTWASPTKSRPSLDNYLFTGSKGWLSINQASKPESTSPILRITIRSVSEDGKEKEEIMEEEMKGVQVELESFFEAVKGQDDGKELGDPFGALTDVAFIQAALNSEGNVVDLTHLMSIKGN